MAEKVIKSASTTVSTSTQQVKKVETPEVTIPAPAPPAPPISFSKMVKLAKGKDYTIFDRTFIFGRACEVSIEQAEYLLNHTEGFFEEVLGGE